MPLLSATHRIVTRSERLQTVLVRRTTAKRRITNIEYRFSIVVTDDNAHQTVQDLRADMRNALETFRAGDDQLRPMLEAADANALPTDKPIISRTVSEDIIDSDEYITSAEGSGVSRVGLKGGFQNSQI